MQASHIPERWGEAAGHYNDTSYFVAFGSVYIKLAQVRLVAGGRGRLIVISLISTCLIAGVQIPLEILTAALTSEWLSDSEYYFRLISLWY